MKIKIKIEKKIANPKRGWGLISSSGMKSDLAMFPQGACGGSVKSLQLFKQLILEKNWNWEDK